MTIRRMAMAWLRAEDWPRWLELDPDFQPDFEHWLRRMLDTEAQLKARGIDAVRVEVLPEEFLAWANSKGLGVDTTTRATYAAFRARNMDLH